MITQRGVGLLVASASVLPAGFAFGYPEWGLLGTCGLVAVAFAAGYAGWRPALRVSRVAEPDRVSRGEACTMTLTVGNRSRWRAATLVAQDRCGSRTVPVPLVGLRPRGDTKVSYPVPTERRGVLPIGPLRVTRRDPLGLASVGRGHGGAVRVWVYPRVLPLRAVPAGVARSLDGRIDRVPHGSITFDALREYVIGDELRHVHWRTSARVGELMVREHLDTSLPQMVVLLDDRAAAYPDAAGGYAEAFEAACEAAASVVAAAVREELPVALYLVAGGDDDPDPGAGGDGAANRGAPPPPGRPVPAPAPANAGTASPRSRRPVPAPPPGRAASADPAFVDSGGRRAETARPFLDLLAEVGLSGGADDTALRTAVDRLRNRQTGDTLVYLTGAGGRKGLGQVASLRGRYPSLVAVLFESGPADDRVGRRPAGAAGTPSAGAAGGQAGTVARAGSGTAARGGTGGDASMGNGTAGNGAAPSGVDGLLVLDARDGDEFAAVWEGMRGW